MGNGIIEYEEPVRAEVGPWLEAHLDCDTIVDDLGNDVLVYAYTKDPAFNFALSRYRREKYENQVILRGISSSGLMSISVLR